ncbi:MAG: hypothetical protein KatS3mg065_0473 [Chloroflexota bacterium]|nr:MAG: hypothetical protein KatS3mg065_0473 [Chloroflexota bacterium]
MGTRRSSATRTRSVEQRARRTPPPARMTGRSAQARSWRIERTRTGSGRSPALGTAGRSRTGASRGSSKRSAGIERRTGPGTAARRLPEALVEEGGELADRRRLGGPLGETADGADEVRLLEGFTAEEGPLDLAGDGEEGRRVGVGGVEGDGEVAGPDGAGHDDRGGATGELPVGLGHEARPGLVAGGDDGDADGVEGVEERQEALARHGEGVPEPGSPEGSGEPGGDASDGRSPVPDGALRPGWSERRDPPRREGPRRRGPRDSAGGALATLVAPRATSRPSVGSAGATAGASRGASSRVAAAGSPAPTPGPSGSGSVRDGSAGRREPRASVSAPACSSVIDPPGADGKRLPGRLRSGADQSG